VSEWLKELVLKTSES